MGEGVRSHYSGTAVSQVEGRPRVTRTHPLRRGWGERPHAPVKTPHPPRPCAMSAAPQRQRRVGLGTALAVGVAVAAVAAYRSRRGQQLTLALGEPPSSVTRGRCCSRPAAHTHTPLFLLLSSRTGDYLDAFAAYGDLSKRLSADLHSFLTQPDEPQQQEDGSLRPQPVRPPLSPSVITSTVLIGIDVDGVLARAATRAAWVRLRGVGF